MELLVEDSVNGGGSLVCSFIANYIFQNQIHEESDRDCEKGTGNEINMVKITYLNKLAINKFKLENMLPMLLTKEKNQVQTYQNPLIINRYLLSNCCFHTFKDSSYSKPKIQDWLDFAEKRKFQIRDANSLEELDLQLEKEVFLTNSSNIDLADLTIFPSVYSYMLSFSKEERISSFPNLTRWYNHIQNLPGVFQNYTQMKFIPFSKGIDLDLVKKLKFDEAKGSKAAQDQKEEKPNEKYKKAEKREDTETSSAKKKEEREKKAKSKPSKEKKEERPIDDVTRLEVRVGVIKKIWKHPEADKLYCLEIEIGEEMPRNIASGLVHYLKEEELLNKKVLVLANMKSKSLRGFLSHGMVLCATSSDGTKIEIMEPPADTPIGERVTWEGLEGEADPVMNTKTGKDPFVAVQLFFKTNEEKIGLFKDKKFETSKGYCSCRTIVGGKIS